MPTFAMVGDLTHVRPVRMLDEPWQSRSVARELDAAALKPGEAGA